MTRAGEKFQNSGPNQGLLSCVGELDILVSKVSGGRGNIPGSVGNMLVDHLYSGSHRLCPVLRKQPSHCYDIGQWQVAQASTNADDLQQGNAGFNGILWIDGFCQGRE